MRTKYKIFGGFIVAGGLITLAAYSLRNYDFAVLNTKGTIAAQQRDLMLFATALSLLVIIPVFVLTILFAYKYRETNTSAAYTPDWDTNRKLEATWWGIPILLIVILSVVTWQTTHSLDPYKPLVSDTKPITVQVVAMQWKWLFIYPEYNIATVNYLQFPEKTPVNFEITSDAPMNSLWIPQLGGQIYAMSGMSTKLHLMADSVGTYNGYSANISGAGFAGMRFVAESTNDQDFAKWVNTVQASDNKLTAQAYAELAKPSENNPVVTYSPVAKGLYGGVIMKYMVPNAQMHGSEAMTNMNEEKN
jgi:cytochrome o ubiquinol oxidase subunit II